MTVDVAALSPEQKAHVRNRLAHELWTRRRARWSPYPWQTAPGPPVTQGMWLMLGGRGTGKTDGAARYVVDHMHGPPCDTRIPGGHRIAIIAPTLGDAVESCVNGPSGLKAHDPSVTLRGGTGGTYVRWPSGAEGKLFGAYTPQDVERLRSGGNRCLVWLEEAAAMRYLADVMKHSRFGLRIGSRPHYVGSTTPKPRQEIRELLADPRVLVTRGSTREAHHLDESVRRELETMYAGTRLGRQELEGEMLDNIEGALWTWAMLEAPGFRVPLEELPQLDRIVVAVDPAVTSGEDSDETGIAVAGRFTPRDVYGLPAHLAQLHATAGLAGRPLRLGEVHGYVLHSEGMRDRPEQVMRRAAQLYHKHKADAVVVESNNGGDYLPAVMRAVDPSVHVELVTATRGKLTRAEPVAALYEQGRAHHVGPREEYAGLEDQLATWVPGVSKRSPDRLDALVWALTALMVGKAGPVSTAPVKDTRLKNRR